MNNSKTTPAPTYEDILRLFQETDRKFQETDRQFQETDRRFQETDRKFQETDRRFKETDRKFKETDRKFQETDHKFQETDCQKKETDREIKEMAREIKEAGRFIKKQGKQIKEQGKQLGGLGEKFGGFTEGLALPSMERILQRRFAMEVVSPSVRVRKGGESIEIDVLSYANSSINEAYVVEVKSHPRQDSIDQLVRLLNRFRTFFPEHKDKTVYGILAGVDWGADIRQMALKTGFHVATIHDNIFKLHSPEGFKPKAW